MEILVKIVAMPFRLIRGIVKHPKVAMVIAGIAVVGIVANNTFGNKPATPQQQAIAASQVDTSYQKNTPNTAYVIATSSRIYYVQAYTKNGSIVRAPAYWDYSLQKWQYHKTPIVLDEKVYGRVDVLKNN